MKFLGSIAALLMILTIVFSGCITDPTGVLGDDNIQEISNILVYDDTSKEKSWVLWREEEIDIGKNGYSMQRPNLDQVYFKDLKVDVDTDNPIDVRFITLKQCEEYQKAWDAYYVKKTASSFNPGNIGYVDYYGSVYDDSVEGHGDENIVIIIEPQGSTPAKGTIRIYYMQ